MCLDVQVGVDTYVDTRESIEGTPRRLAIKIVFGMAGKAKVLPHHIGEQRKSTLARLEIAH